MFMLAFSALCEAIGWLQEWFLRIIKKLKIAIIDGTAWIQQYCQIRERERERDHGADFQVQIIDGIDTGRDQSHESHEAMTG